MLLKDVENMKEGEEELKMDLKEMGYSTVEQALLHMMKRVEVEGKGCKNLALTFRLPCSGAGDQASRGWRGPGIKPLRLWVQLQGLKCCHERRQGAQRSSQEVPGGRTETKESTSSMTRVDLARPEWI
ncbi:uncharacterized protein [Littorina saxatilis]|uniref:uncharacterized protein n=1 Tax=Littorina saxatilis TaxID=31220 RepID=UPI0038B477DE